jgi:hypothetical protein
MGHLGDAASGRRSCETKPIPRRAGPVGGRLCKTKPISGSPAGVRGWIVQNEANWPEVTVRNEPNFARAPGNGRWLPEPPRANCAKRSQFPVSRAAGNARLCETKPIWLVGRGPGGQTARNEANFRRAEIPPPFQYSIIPAFRSDADCAKRSQSRRGRVGWGLGSEGRLCKTNPISESGPAGAGSRWYKRSQFVRRGQRSARAGEVTSGGVAWARCAKQTQFATDGQERPSPRPEALTMPPVRRQVHQTKPIWPEDGYGREPARRSARPPTGPIVRNKANSPTRAEMDADRHRCQCRGRYPSCETKPISALSEKRNASFCFIQPPAGGRVCTAHQNPADGAKMVCDAHPTGHARRNRWTPRVAQPSDGNTCILTFVVGVDWL